MTPIFITGCDLTDVTHISLGSSDLRYADYPKTGLRAYARTPVFGLLQDILRKVSDLERAFEAIGLSTIDVHHLIQPADPQPQGQGPGGDIHQISLDHT